MWQRRQPCVRAWSAQLYFLRRLGAPSSHGRMVAWHGGAGQNSGGRLLVGVFELSADSHDVGYLMLCCCGRRGTRCTGLGSRSGTS